MNEREFCYWLKGYIDMASPVVGLEPEQLNNVKVELLNVFNQKSLPVQQDNVRTVSSNFVDTGIKCHLTC
jgi:hypothetical protein